MTLNLHNLADRPAASVTDEEVAGTIEVMTADPRVTKAVHVGREGGAADGRQMLDFEMTGFSGVHTLGRCISAFFEADRLAAAAAEKERKAAEKKVAARRKKLASIRVPAEGQDEAFDEWAYDIEVDFVGVPGEWTSDPERRAELYLDYLEDLSSRKRKAGAADGAKTRAKNAAKGISQKGLTGSTKQKRWASEIRAGKLAGFSDENRKFLAENDVHSSFWIEYRNVSGAGISARMDAVYDKTKAAIAAQKGYLRQHETEKGVVVTQESDDLRKAVTAAQNKWHRLLNGDEKWS